MAGLTCKQQGLGSLCKAAWLGCAGGCRSDEAHHECPHQRCPRYQDCALRHAACQNGLSNLYCINLMLRGISLHFCSVSDQCSSPMTLRECTMCPVKIYSSRPVLVGGKHLQRGPADLAYIDVNVKRACKMLGDRLLSRAAAMLV